MSIYSAQRQLERLCDSSADPEGFCLPLSLDAIMRTAELPDEYYNIFAGLEGEEPSDVVDEGFRRLFEDYFGVEFIPDPQGRLPGLFDAFGSSPQNYCSDPKVDYEGELEIWQGSSVTAKQLRMRDVLNNARQNNCHVLPYLKVEDDYEHIGGLELVDPGSNSNEAYYVLRDFVRPASDHLYTANELSGITTALGGYGDEYAPLPEFDDPSYPAYEKSWAFLVFPPEPKV